MKSGTDEPICKAEVKTQMQRIKTYGYHRGKGGWDELGDWH